MKKTPTPTSNIKSYAENSELRKLAQFLPLLAMTSGGKFLTQGNFGLKNKLNKMYNMTGGVGEGEVNKLIEKIKELGVSLTVEQVEKLKESITPIVSDLVAPAAPATAPAATTTPSTAPSTAPAATTAPAAEEFDKNLKCTNNAVDILKLGKQRLEANGKKLDPRLMEKMTENIYKLEEIEKDFINKFTILNNYLDIIDKMGDKKREVMTMEKMRQAIDSCDSASKNLTDSNNETIKKILTLLNNDPYKEMQV